MRQDLRDDLGLLDEGDEKKFLDGFLAVIYRSDS
jgi:hypothetical protein